MNVSIEEDGNSRKRTEENGKRGEAGDESSTDKTYNTSESTTDRAVMDQGVERFWQ